MAKFKTVTAEDTLSRIVKNMGCKMTDDGETVAVDSPSGKHFDGGSHCIKAGYADAIHRRVVVGDLIDCLNTSPLERCDCQ